MSFMKQSIVYGKWTEIDSASGIVAIPSDLTPLTNAAFANESIDDVLKADGVANELIQYCEVRHADQIYNVEQKDGYGARMSAPGYMDCTEWCVFDTKKEAQDYLDEYYGDDDEDDDIEEPEQLDCSPENTI